MKNITKITLLRNILPVILFLLMLLILTSCVSRSIIPVRDFSPFVKIWVYTGSKGSYHLGSGTFITPKCLLTNFHVVGNKWALENHVQIQTIHGWEIGKIIWASDMYDAAIVCNDKEHKYVFLGDGFRMSYLDDVYVVGSPGYEFNTISVGKLLFKNYGVQLNDGFESTYDYFVTTANVRPGNSGGALLDKNGEIIGLITYFIPYPRVEIKGKVIAALRGSGARNIDTLKGIILEQTIKWESGKYEKRNNNK